MRMIQREMLERMSSGTVLLLRCLHSEMSLLNLRKQGSVMQHKSDLLRLRVVTITPRLSLRHLRKLMSVPRPWD